MSSIGPRPKRVDPSRSAVAAALLLAVLSLAPVPARGGDFDLLGSWHVTVHYRDEASANPDTDRWQDNVWRFEERGSRLQWTEFPIVVFKDRAGRFEIHAGSRERRILHHWEPSAEQLQEIRAGLLVNPRGAKSKGLRGTPSSGYRSVGGLRAESASVIGYSESWSIKGLDAKPVFTRDDIMGSGITEDMQGRTQYTAESVSADRNELRGRYERDGTRHGTFVMRRAGDSMVMGGKKDRRRKNRDGRAETNRESE